MRTKHWLLVILVVGGILRFLPWWFGLPYLQARPDESVAAGIASGMLRGDLNPHFFHWPSLTFYLFATAFWLANAVGHAVNAGAALEAADYFVIGRVIVAAAGTATLGLLFLLGRRVSGDRVGLIAAALLAVAILHVRESHFAMTDALATFFVVASLVTVLRGHDDAMAGKGGLRWFAAAGLLAGLATSTKYNAAAVGASMAAAQVLLLVRQRRLLSLLPSVVYGLLLLLGFFAGSPYSVLDFPKFREDVIFDVTHLSGGHGINLGRGWIYHLQRSLPYGAGPWTFVAAVVGIIPLARRRPAHALIVGAFAAFLYVSIGSGYTVFFRYILPLVPVLCLSAAMAVEWAAEHAGRQTRAALVIVLVGAGLVNCVWFDVLLARTDSRVLAAGWIAPQLQRGHTLHDAGGDYTALDLARISFHEWHFDPAENSFGDAAGRTPDWLVLYESPLHTYTRIPWQLRTLADTSYDLVHAVRTTTGSRRDAVYDLQDAFFMPVWGFWTVERPGPTVLIYKRRQGQN